jgi:hypothetical protein
MDVGKTRAQAAPKSVEALVQHALKLAATKPSAKWTGASAAALFNTKDENHQAAIAECTKPDAPLLKQVGKVGVLTTAGFERIATEMPAEEVASLAKAMAAGMSAVERVAFLPGVISRTSGASAELTPLLEEAVVAKNAELEAQAAEKVKQATTAEANRAALKRALELSAQDFQNEVNALKLQWEALGQKLSALPAHKPAPKPEAPAPKPTKPEATDTAPKLRTEEETDFRRYECDRLAAAWRDAWDANKDEGRDYLETAMWNIRGFRMIGEVGATVEFDGRYHESDASGLGGPVTIARPGWMLKEDEGNYVALKAAVTKG